MSGSTSSTSPAPASTANGSTPSTRAEARPACDFDGATCEKLEGSSAQDIAKLLDVAAVLPGLRAGRRGRTRPRDHARVHPRTLRLRQADRGLPGHQASNGRPLVRDRDRAQQRLLRAPGRWRTRTRSSPTAAPIARIAACEAFEDTTVEMIEFHGGVGYTWEYDCHLFYRRAKLLSSSLGTPKYWKNLLIDRLQAEAAA